jgi:hypothetical protein
VLQNLAPRQPKAVALIPKFYDNSFLKKLEENGFTKPFAIKRRRGVRLESDSENKMMLNIFTVIALLVVALAPDTSAYAQGSRKSSGGRHRYPRPNGFLG